MKQTQEEGKYLIHCYDCDYLGRSDWLDKASSDASWHNTMNGHNCEVYDDETDSVAYRPGGESEEDEVQSMQVTIMGPNLRTQDEAMHVHKAGCADLTRSPVYRGHEGWTITATSAQAVVWDIYDPSNFCYDAETEWEEYASDVKFFPCVDDLPTTEPKVDAEASDDQDDEAVYTQDDRPTSRELASLPTLCTGQAADLKSDSDGVRFWLARTDTNDGEPFDSTVYIEVLFPNGRWVDHGYYNGETGDDFHLTEQGF